MTTILQHLFGGDELDFTVTTNAALAVQKSRTYSRISDVAQEVVEARMLLGLHFRFADDEGRRLGSRAASRAYRSVLRPLPGGNRVPTPGGVEP